MDEEKKKKIYTLLVKIQKNEEQRIAFIEQFYKLSWYIDAGVPYSDSQLDEMITFLEGLTKKIE